MKYVVLYNSSGCQLYCARVETNEDIRREVMNLLTDIDVGDQIVIEEEK